MEKQENMMDIEDIQKVLRHRYPFLLVDRVTGLEFGSSISAYKNVTYNEPFFQGHFPKFSIMPGVLTLEAMVQTAGILSYKTLEQQAESSDEFHKGNENFIYILAGTEKVRFRKPVVPGDCLQMFVEILKVKSDIWKYRAVATVDDIPVCDALIYCKGEEKKNLLRIK